MNRYALFAGCLYYPNGGWADYQGTFGTLAEAKAEMERLEGLGLSYEGDFFAHIVDMESGEIIEGTSPSHADWTAPIWGSSMEGGGWCILCHGRLEWLGRELARCTRCGYLQEGEE